MTSSSQQQFTPSRPKTDAEIAALRAQLRHREDGLHSAACVCESCFRWPADVDVTSQTSPAPSRRRRSR